MKMKKWDGIFLVILVREFVKVILKFETELCQCWSLLTSWSFCIINRVRFGINYIVSQQENQKKRRRSHEVKFAAKKSDTSEKFRLKSMNLFLWRKWKRDFRTMKIKMQNRLRKQIMDFTFLRPKKTTATKMKEQKDIKLHCDNWASALKNLRQNKFNNFIIFEINEISLRTR